MQYRRWILCVLFVVLLCILYLHHHIRFCLMIERFSTTAKEIDTFFVHPCSGYLLSKHIVCSKKEAKKYKSRFSHVAKQNELFNTPSLFHRIQNNDVVYVHTDPQMIRYFLETIVPYLKKHKIKVILFTGKETLPQVRRTDLSDRLLACDEIRLWISQNPIYDNHPKYFAFPYGLRSNRNMLNIYRTYYRRPNVTKTIFLSNMAQLAHQHLSKGHIRNKHKELFHKDKLRIEDYMDTLHRSKFTVSTAGDRDDCYRHYESILMGCIPVTNIRKPLYEQIFGDNMVFMSDDELVSCVKRECELTYRKPNQDIVLLSFWKSQVERRLGSTVTLDW